MRQQGLAVPSLLALLMGTVHTHLFIMCWAYIAVYTPLPLWLVTLGVTGFSWRLVLFVTDLLVGILLCLPAAYLLCRLRPPKLALYLALAVLPGFLWQYRGLATAAPSLDWFSYVPGMLLALASLPIAALVVQWTFRPGAPNNSLGSNGAKFT